MKIQRHATPENIENVDCEIKYLDFIFNSFNLCYWGVAIPSTFALDLPLANVGEC